MFGDEAFSVSKSEIIFGLKHEHEREWESETGWEGSLGSFLIKFPYLSESGMTVRFEQILSRQQFN